MAQPGQIRITKSEIRNNTQPIIGPEMTLFHIRIPNNPNKHPGTRVWGHFEIIIIAFITLVWLTVSSCTSVPATNTAAPNPSPSSSLIISPSPSASVTQTIPTCTYQIVRVYPHDTQGFTEGLVYSNGFLYESTGLNGKSSLRKVELETGKVLQVYNLPEQYFGEGLAIYQNTLIQLTWQTHIGFVYDQSTFNILRTFSYNTEGWGLTFDGKQLIMSDGTSKLFFLDPVTLKVTHSIEVNDSGVPVTNINELEYIKGVVYANIWQTDKIAIIDPQNGKVSGWIDLSGLLQTQNYSGQVDVLNGIAYNAQNDRLFVTGKLWPYLFEINLVPAGH